MRKLKSRVLRFAGGVMEINLRFYLINVISPSENHKMMGGVAKYNSYRP